MVNRDDDHGHQSGRDGHGGRDGDDARGHVGHLSGRSVHLHGGCRAGRDGPEPDQRSDGRRHAGDDHRHGFTGATAVDFGTTAATNVTVVNDTRSRPTARPVRAPWT